MTEQPRCPHCGSQHVSRYPAKDHIYGKRQVGAAGLGALMSAVTTPTAQRYRCLSCNTDFCPDTRPDTPCLTPEPTEAPDFP